MLLKPLAIGLVFRNPNYQIIKISYMTALPFFGLHLLTGTRMATSNNINISRALMFNKRNHVCLSHKPFIHCSLVFSIFIFLSYNLSKTITFFFIIFLVIVSLTKFSTVIGSPRAYLQRNRRAITWVPNYRYSIWTFCNWIPTWFARQLRALSWLPSGCFQNKKTRLLPE